MNRHESERVAHEQAGNWRRDAAQHDLARTAGEPAADALLHSVREARRDALARAASAAPRGRGILEALGRRLHAIAPSAFSGPGRPARDAQPGSSRPLESADTGL